MAVVGEAKIVVRAITNTFKRDVERAAAGFNDAGRQAGEDFGDGVGDGFGRRARRGLSRRFEATIEQARQQFRRLAIASNIVIPAVGALVGIIGNLVSGLVILIAAVGNAAKALGVGLLGAITAVGQAAVTLGVAFRGFGEAMNQARGASSGAANAARAEEAALRRLRDARLNLKQLIEEEAPAELAAARQRATDAADQAAAAVRSQEQAQRRYNDAQLEVLRSQEDLNDAREEAKEKLQQLRFELEGAALGEKRARLEFEKARDSLQAVQDLPPDSRARQEAELAFAQAELNLRKAIDNNSDLRKEENAATAAGVEGSEEVVNAKERIADAIQAERDAAVDAALAIREAARAQQEANQAAADAAAGGRVERELQRRIAAAREQVRDAERAVEDARRSAAGAANQIKVTPEQLAFAKYLRSLREEFYELRRAAGLELFPALETALGNIVSGLFPTLRGLLQSTGGVLGGIAVNFSEVVTEGENVRRLESVWGTNNELLTNLGIAGGNLYEALLLILEAAEPVITAFGEWAASSSAQFVEDLAAQGDGLRESFERNLEIFRDIKEVLGNTFGTFGNLGAIINEEGGAADQLLGYLKDVTKQWEEFTGSEEGKNYLRDFFEGSGANFQELLSLLGLIGKGFLELGAEEGIGDFLRSLQDVTKVFNEFGIELAESGALTAFGEALAAVGELLITLTESGALTVFFNTIKDIALAVNEFFSNETVQSIFAVSAKFFAFFLAIGSVFRIFRFFGRAFAGFIKILPGGGRLLGFFAGLWDKLGVAIAKGIGSLGKFVGRAIGNLGKVIFGFFKGLGPKLAGLFARIGPLLLNALRFIGPILLRVVGAVLGGIPGLVILLIATLVGLFFQFKDEIIGFFSEVGSGVWEGMKIAWEQVTEFFDGIRIWLNERIVAIVEGIAQAGSNFFSWIGDLWDQYWEYQTNRFNAFVDGVKALPGRIATAASNFWEWIKDLWKEYWEYQKQRFEDFIADIKALPGKLAEVGRNLWTWLKDSFKDALNWLIRKWNDFRLDLRVPDNFFSRALGIAGKGITLNTPNIPLLAQGGIVSPRGGGTLAMIAEAGRPERVEPLDSDGLSKRDRAMIAMLSGGGSTINVYPSPGMNESELARKVSRELAKQVRKGAS